MGAHKAAPLFLLGLLVAAVGVYLMFGLGVMLLLAGVVLCVAAVFFYEPQVDVQRRAEQRARLEAIERGKPKR